MALSQLRMHHLRTGALPPRTPEECEFLANQEGAPPVVHADTCPDGCEAVDREELPATHTIAHHESCPVSAPGYLPNLASDTHECTCDFLQRVAAFLNSEPFEGEHVAVEEPSGIPLYSGRPLGEADRTPDPPPPPEPTPIHRGKRKR